MIARWADTIAGEGFWARDLEPLPGRQKVAAIVVAIAVLLLIIELVRRRKLREEYSWLWAVTGAVMAVLAIYQDLLVTLSRWIGAASPVSTLFFGALLFLLTLTLQFSVRLSRLTHRNRTLAQRMALLEKEIERLHEERGRGRRTGKSEAERDEVA